MGSPEKSTHAVMVIMAGGAGERFWPVSNRTTPKQLLKLHGEKTMLEAAFDRAARLVPKENVYVVAGEQLRDAVFKNLTELRAGNYIAEPFARNTAACLGLAACHIEAVHGPETVMGVLTADHVIEEGPAFNRPIRAAMIHAAKHDHLVTIGIQPRHPDTGFGYLKIGEKIATATLDGVSEPIYRVERFTEKPDLATAEAFLQLGNYLWNSGMFFWRVGTLLNAFEAHQPIMAEQFKRLRETGKPSFERDLVREVFEALPSLPIDTAILEKSNRVAAVRGTFAWEDIGSWDALSRIRMTDESGNCQIGASVILDSRNNIVYNVVQESEAGHLPVIVLHGVEDLIVVRTDKAILITPKSHAQKVKQIVRHLTENERHDLL